MTSIFYFFTFLTKQIHNDLIRIAKGEMDKTFCWYSILMYIFLYKGSALIRNDMKLVKESEGEKMLVQLWNAHITYEASSASFIHF